MVVYDASGSSLSRATTAGVNEMITPERLIQRFSLEANRQQRMEEVAAGVVIPGLSSDPSHKAGEHKAGNPRERGFKEERIPFMTPSGGAGRLITVMGASGGVGKSALAACLAATAAAKEVRTLVVDADLQFGCMHRAFGVEKPVTFDEAVADENALERLAVNTQAGTVAVLAAPSRLEHSESLNSSVARIAAAATSLFDVVIADTGASWSDAHASLMEISTCTLFIIDQRSESVRACQHALDLCDRMGLATGSFTFALNRCSKDAPFMAVDVSCALNGAHINALEDGGREVEELCGSGMALSLALNGNAFAQSVDQLACTVMPEVFGESKAQMRKEKSSLAFWSFGQRRSRQRRRQRREHEIVVQAGPPHPEFRSAKHAWESL